MITFDMGNGTVFEVPDEQFLNLLAVLAKGYADLAEQYIENHLSGLADFDGDYYSNSIAQIRLQFVTIDAVVRDETLLDGLHTLFGYLQKLENNDQRIVYEYANYFGLLHPGEDIDRRKVKKKVLASRVQNVYVPDNVMTIAKESGSFYSQLQNLIKVIEERINILSGVERR
jgi:hypothetical protein